MTTGRDPTPWPESDKVKWDLALKATQELRSVPTTVLGYLELHKDEDLVTLRGLTRRSGP